MKNPSNEQHLKFASHVLETQIFGTFWLAIEARRDENGLTQNELAERSGRDKTNISKLLDGPRNWTTRTISDLAEGLDVRIVFVLEDKLKPERTFTPTGVKWDTVSVSLAIMARAVGAENCAGQYYTPYNSLPMQHSIVPTVQSAIDVRMFHA